MKGAVRVSGLEPLQEALGYRFCNAGLLKLALTHPSVIHEADGGHRPHNQRLEFLGDSVLGMVLAAELYQRFPGFGEGPLTQARAQLVNRRTLAQQAVRLGLGPLLIMSRGEEQNQGRERPSALADGFEAVVGAVYLDGGLAAATALVMRCYKDVLGELDAIPNLENPKGELQEMLQARSINAPVYKTLGATGPDHDRLFECSVWHEGQELARGQGKSKKDAECQAAAAALKELRLHPPAQKDDGE